ncbi:MAG: glycosyltransferase [Candidatus Symbiothrix sp.]|jgi:glycosyltransferase involved in cell wall biosynthesis|nr:glycosyltransferase [Candidatus Symbiothrix sp.]
MEITFNTSDIWLLSALSIFLIIQLIYYWLFLSKPYFHLRKIRKGKISFPHSSPAVSVIIYARNKSKNLEAFLPSVLEQNYPEFEVIVVYDDISDNSENVLKRLKAQYPSLYYTYIPQGTKGLSRKKLGLTLGIKAAKFDVLLFSDADSHPVGESWIKNMSRHLSERKTIVLGFCALEKHSGLGYKFADYDYFFMNLRMAASALLKFSYNANGRNLLYKKEYFDRRKGYSKYRRLQAGEDDLFIDEIATKENMAVELSPGSIISVSRDDFFDWKSAKINQATTRHFYKKMPLLFWRFESWSRFFFLLLFFVCIFHDFWNWILPFSAIIAFIIRLFSQLFVINKTSACMKLRKYYFLFPFFDAAQPVVNTYFYIRKLFRGKINYSWKYEK